MIHDVAARGFASGADDYDRGRPSYPPAALELIAHRLALRPGRRVLDLAAGSGRLTAGIAPTGVEIVAVEPVVEMRSRIRAVAPDAVVLDGTAEAIPLPNASVDAVVVGQAFHWFRAAEAVSELHRVLRPAGALALVWNARDEDAGWDRELGEVVDRLAGDAPRYRDGAWRVAFDQMRLFEPLELRSFHHVQRLDVAGAVARVASISYIAAAPARERDELLAATRSLFESRLADADGLVTLPYRTDVYLTRPTPVPAAGGLVASVNMSRGGVPKPPAGSAWIGALGLEGDAHREPEPVHGGPDQAVSLYAQEAIERVRVDGHRAFPGAYGENLTLLGLRWAELAAGDRIVLGEDAVELELVKYAAPCQTIAHWFDGRRIARVSPKVRPEDSRWLARVIREGRVAAGDQVRVVHRAAPARGGAGVMTAVDADGT